MEPEELLELGRSFIGVPWLSYGKDRAGMDCVGLVLAFVKEAYGKDMAPMLPPYDQTDFSKCIGLLDIFNLYFHHIALTEIRTGDVVILGKQINIPSHTGVYMEGDLLHITISTGVICTPLNRLCRRSKILYVGRIKSWA